MLTCGRNLRFTREEIETHRGVGVDIDGVTSRDQYARAIEFWALCLAEARPDILFKFEDMLRTALAEKQANNPPPRQTRL